MYNLNSLVAYFEVLPQLGQCQKEVLSAIQELTFATDYEIAEHLKRPINTITPRRLELAQKKLIITPYSKPNQFGRLASVWKLNSNYKEDCQNRTIDRMGLEKAQEPLSLPKVKYFVRKEGKLVQVN